MEKRFCAIVFLLELLLLNNQILKKIKEEYMLNVNWNKMSINIRVVSLDGYLRNIKNLDFRQQLILMLKDYPNLLKNLRIVGKKKKFDLKNSILFLKKNKEKMIKFYIYIYKT